MTKENECNVEYPSRSIAMVTRNRRQKWHCPRGRRKRRQIMKCPLLLQFMMVATCLRLHPSSLSYMSAWNEDGQLNHYDHQHGHNNRRQHIMMMGAEAFSTPLLTSYYSHSTTHCSGCKNNFNQQLRHFTLRFPTQRNVVGDNGTTSSRRNIDTSRNSFTVLPQLQFSRMNEIGKLSSTCLSLATTTTREDNLDASLSSMTGKSSSSSSSVETATLSSATNDATITTPNSSNSNTANSNKNNNQNTWLDRTTARLLDTPASSHTSSSPRNNIQSNNSTTHQATNMMAPLTPDDVNLITTLMTSHARRSTIESARICEQLLKRVVEEVNRGNEDVRVTTKMYTVGECRMLIVVVVIIMILLLLKSDG